MKLAAVAVALLAILPAAADAAGPPKPASLAAQLCSVELKLSAATFRARYGAGAAGRKACLRVNAARAGSAVQTCTASGTCKQLERAKQSCLRDWKALGKAGFARKWGPGRNGGVACLRANGAR